MEFAIVDIETTGGYASGSGITEIAILVHDGKKIIKRYETLVNPLYPIPVYIQALTGISEEMVAESPTFEKIAGQVYNLLKGRIFVAHNVNFDYSFIKHQLESAGYPFTAQKLCTVRLSRKIKPGLSSYSLGKLCDTLQIPLSDRHRAAGDAMATAILFSRLLEWDTEGHSSRMLAKKSREQQLPPNMPYEEFDKLPSCPGVYYFLDRTGKAVYVGKAKNIRKRVSSHFTGHSAQPQRQHFLRSIFSIQYERCGTELMALLLEAVEIKRLWPPFNRAMKRQEPKFALYAYEDQQGYLRLAVDKHRKGSTPIHLFSLYTEAVLLLKKLIHDFELHPAFCGFKAMPQASLTPTQEPETSLEELTPEVYNLRVENALHQLTNNLPSFAILDRGREEDEQSCIWVENGSLYGFGYISQYTDLKSRADLRDSITPYRGNHYMVQLIQGYAERFPQKVLRLEREAE